MMHAGRDADSGDKVDDVPNETAGGHEKATHRARRPRVLTRDLTST